VSSKISDYVIRNCTIAFKCKKKWENMKETDIPIIRHCSDCDKEVFQVSTVRQLKTFMLLNRCVAIDLELVAMRSQLVGVVIPRQEHT
jgi:hypothetical protein